MGFPEGKVKNSAEVKLLPKVTRFRITKFVMHILPYLRQSLSITCFKQSMLRICENSVLTLMLLKRLIKLVASLVNNLIRVRYIYNESLKNVVIVEVQK